MAKRYLIQVSLSIFVLISGALVGCNSQPPFFKGTGEPVKLVNNSGASTHTWDEIVRFLIQDNTDTVPYTTRHNSFNFAEELHNKAEYYGFKTAFVLVEFDNGDSYALDAFDTIDLGLIYVDSTGEGYFDSVAQPMIKEYAEVTIQEQASDLEMFWAFQSNCLTYLQIALSPLRYRDKVAYVVEGKRMGFISVEFTGHDFSYEHFIGEYAQLLDFIAWSLKSAIEHAVIRDTIIHRLKCGLTKLSVDEASKEARSEEYFFKDWVDRVLIPEWKEVRAYDWEISGSNVKSIAVYW